MAKAMVAILAIVLFIIYKDIHEIKNAGADLKRDVTNMTSINSIIKDKLAIKEKEIEQKNFEILKFNVNYEAFNGTACAKCHLEPSNLFPYDRNLTLEKYISVVRGGIEGVMPSYVDRPNKGARDITDSELRRQYRILKTLYEKRSEIQPTESRY